MSAGIEPLFTSALGSQTPWSVKEVKLDTSRRCIDINPPCISWAQEEHATTLYLVRVVQFVDGARQVDADAGMCAPGNQGYP